MASGQIERTVERTIFLGDRTPTIRDVRAEIDDLQHTLMVCGCERFVNKLKRIIRKLIAALSREKGVPKRKVLDLPQDTTLGKRAKRWFFRLWTWLDSNVRKGKGNKSQTRQPRRRR